MSKRAFKGLVSSFYFMLCVLFLGQVTAFADEVKPVHEYNFEYDSNTIVYDSFIGKDAVGGVNHVSSSPVTGYNGIGQAKHFENRDYLGIPSKALPVGARSIRFQFRKNASTVTGKSEPILLAYNGMDGYTIYMGIGNNALNIDSELEASKPGSLWIIEKNTSINFELQSPDSICDGEWHDILYTWDGTTNNNSVKLYVDNMTTPVAQTTATTTDKHDISNDNYIFVGISPARFNGMFGGYTDLYLIKADLDNLQFFDSAINVKESNLISLKANGKNSKIDLSWDAVIKATSYTVKRSATAEGPYTTIATDITETSYTDTNVTNGTMYYYVVTATNNGTEIANSNEASAQPTEPQTPPTTEAKLKVVLEVAESLRLSVDDDINVNTQMSWSSSDPTVATVNEKGIVTALTPGNTVITVKSEDGSYTDYINVLVVENADDYRLAIDLKIGETARLTADDFTNTANITWAPMDSSIANVTTKGKVTALSKGLVLISAKDAEGNIIGRVYVRVRE